MLLKCSISAIIVRMTQISGQGTAAVTSGGKPLPSGKQIYDALMAQIEPDLVSANIAGLEEKYRGESEVEKLKRAERYSKAMTEYDKRYAALMASLQQDIAAQKRDGIAVIEKKSSAKEAAHMQGLESAILSA